LKSYGIAVYTDRVEFEWDPVKAAANLAKHGVSFEDATLVFDDPLQRVAIDNRTYVESRYQVIGTVNGRLLFVAYTLRGMNICRIISARRASCRERATYSLSPGP
jgi:uncharacterized DUF497 family protein